MTRLLTVVFFLICLFGSRTVWSQEFPEIRITISGSQLGKLLESKGQKITLKEPVLLINGAPASVKEIHSRGNNSLTFPHKSLAVDLENPVSFDIDGEKIKMKKFDLMNLVMDKNLWHNRWAFLHMKALGIFPLANTFCTLWINDQPQGVYLLVEKPSAFVSRINSPYMLRRGADHKIDDEYFDEKVKIQAKAYKAQYLEVYDKAGKLKGQELLDQLKASIFLEHYFDWLAFNYLIMNGDYADEVFLYILPGMNRFDVLPWDYDDILRPAPHEGAQARNAVPDFKTKLIFSSEDPLDRSIATDHVVYAGYLAELRKVLEALPPEMITAITEKVKEELRKVIRQPEIADASLFLGKDKFKMTDAEEDIRIALDFILKRRNGLMAVGNR